MEVVKGDTGSLDHSSYEFMLYTGRDVDGIWGIWDLITRLGRSIQ